MSTIFNNFSSGFRTNHIAVTSLSAGKNIELINTPYGRNIAMANGNSILTQINGEKVIGGFDYIKADTHHHIVFTNTGTQSKAYLYQNNVATLIKSGMSADARFFKGVNFKNGAFITNGINSFFYEYNVIPAVIDVNPISYDGTTIKGLTIAVFDGRIFMACGSGLYSSGLGDYTDWSSSDVQTTRAGYMKNFMNSSATIIGLINYGNSLIIHRTTDTVRLSGTSGGYDMSTISNVGCASPFALANLDVMQFYFIKHPNGVGLFNLSINELGTLKADEEISTFVHEEFLNIDTARLNEIYCISYSKKNQIWIHIPRTDYANNSYWLIYDFNGKFFLPPRITQPILSAWLFDGDLLTGTADGKVLKEDSGKTFAGDPIEFSADTQSMNFGTLLQKEAEDNCLLELDGKRQNNFILSFIKNDDERYIRSQLICPAPRGCMIWAPNKTVVDPKYNWGQKWASRVPQILRKGKPSKCRTTKVRFSSSGAGSDLGLISLELPKMVLS